MQGFEGNWSIRRPKKQPPLSKVNMQKQLVWTKTFLKLDFQKFLFSDECRATLEVPARLCRCWLRHGQSTPNRFKRQQSGDRIIFWAIIYKKHLIGPFRVDDCVKMDSKAYCELLKNKFLPFIRSYFLRNEKNLFSCLIMRFLTRHTSQQTF